MGASDTSGALAANVCNISLENPARASASASQPKAKKPSNKSAAAVVDSWEDEDLSDDDNGGAGRADTSRKRKDAAPDPRLLSVDTTAMNTLASSAETPLTALDPDHVRGIAAPPPTPLSPTGNTGNTTTTNSSSSFSSSLPSPSYSAVNTPPPYGILDGNGTSSGKAPAPEGSEPMRRPEKTDAVARRMIAGALGMKAPRMTAEQRAYNDAIRTGERKRRDLEKESQKKAEEEAAKARQAVWDE